ncbi:flagellar assembly protein A [candidate division KSB1 bacterium]
MSIIPEISKDEKKAFITVLDEENGARPVIEELLDSLNKIGVYKGINEKVLKQICRDKLFNRKYQIASVIPPKKGDNAKIKLITKKKERSSFDKGVNKDIKVDHYGVREDFLTLVRKDQLILKRIPPTQGESGFSVSGKEIPGLFGTDVSWKLLSGNNTYVRDNCLFASIDGALERIEGSFNVKNIITLENDVGLKTGSIILPLDADIELIVPGDVKNGFTVQCRDIKIMGTLGDAKVKAKSLEVNRGIVGTSDLPIMADHIKTGFINGTRRIKSKYIEIKKEATGGCEIHSDFVKSHILQECKIVSKYGVWTKYLFGKNDILVGVDVTQNEKFENWNRQLKGVVNILNETKEKNHGLIKKADKVKAMAKRMPDNPKIKDEVKKTNEVMFKITKLENIKNSLEKEIQKHFKLMYVGGSAFILIEFGFGKKTLETENKKAINNLTIRETTYDRTQPFITGMYTLKNDIVVANSKYNVLDMNKLVENYKEASLKDEKLDEDNKTEEQEEDKITGEQENKNGGSTAE